MGEICEVNPTTVLPDSFEYVDLESVVGTDMISHRREEKLTAPSRAQRLASFGDIFYQTVRPYQKNNYFYELPDKDYVFSTGYAQLRPLCDGRFLFSSLQREQFVFCVLERCTGTSYPAINANDLAALPLAVPNDIEEQRLVGSILKPIDSLITLHQRKCQYRSLYGYLSWEQRKLGNIVASFDYGLNAAATEYDGQNKYLRITDIDDTTHEFLKSDLTTPLADLAMSADYLLEEGDLLFARTGASVGKTYLYRQYDGTVYFAGFLIRARIGESADPEFVYQATLTDAYKKYVAITSQRSGQPGVNAQEYADYQLMLPSRTEQQQIGMTLRSLDNFITLHQREPRFADTG